MKKLILILLALLFTASTLQASDDMKSYVINGQSIGIPTPEDFIQIPDDIAEKMIGIKDFADNDAGRSTLFFNKQDARDALNGNLPQYRDFIVLIKKYGDYQRIPQKDLPIIKQIIIDNINKQEYVEFVNSKLPSWNANISRGVEIFENKIHLETDTHFSWSTYYSYYKNISNVKISMSRVRSLVLIKDVIVSVTYESYEDLDTAQAVQADYIKKLLYANNTSYGNIIEQKPDTVSEWEAYIMESKLGKKSPSTTSKPSSVTKEPELTIYHNESTTSLYNIDYKLSYPSTWTLEKDTSLATSLIPNGAKRHNTARVFFTVNRQALPNGLADTMKTFELGEVLASIMYNKNIGADLFDFDTKIISKDIYPINSYSALSYELTASNEKNGRYLYHHMKVYYVFIDQRYIKFVLTIFDFDNPTNRKNIDNEFAELVTEFDKFVHTLEVNNY